MQTRALSTVFNPGRIIILALCLLSAPSTRADTLWEMKRLSKPPVATFGVRAGLLQEVYYEGEKLNGSPTRVFAYYARPEGTGPFPGMVLVHGGGGKAFSDWALHWANRGYAAIAMDLSGNGPAGKLPDGGPDQSDTVKFRPYQVSEAREMWTYHAVAAAVRAHSLLASLKEVDSRRIGVTGISWGGYLTCIIASVDHRFKAAVPVYGCGFLGDNSVWKEPVLDKMPAELRDHWIAQFDPSTYLSRMRCATLFLNGTNDFAYPMDSYRKSFDLVRGNKRLSMQIRLPHGHIWTFGIVDAFVDSALRNGPPLPTIGRMRMEGERIVAALGGGGQAVKAELCFSADRGRWQERTWVSVAARVEGRRVVAELPDPVPEAWYLSVKDTAGNVITTAHMTRDELKSTVK